MSSSSMGMISPPASTFGIKSELDSDPKQPSVQKNKMMEFKTNYDIPEFSLLGKFEKLNQNSEPKMYISPLSDKTNLQH
jgi:chemotaxis protein CheY-P-specific phosphatase CheC